MGQRACFLWYKHVKFWWGKDFLKIFYRFCVSLFFSFKNTEEITRISWKLLKWHFKVVAWQSAHILWKRLLVTLLDRPKIFQVFVAFSRFTFRRNCCATKEKDTWFEDLPEISFCQCSEENVCDSRTYTSWQQWDWIYWCCKGSSRDTTIHGKWSIWFHMAISRGNFSLQ